MKKSVRLLYMVLAVVLTACHDQYIKDYYITPRAAFEISAKDSVDIQTSVFFTNRGEGQTYAVWTGDAGHEYGKQGECGFTVSSNGSFSYAYSEPGDYLIVWIASSVNAKGDVVSDVDSVRLLVNDHSSGIDEFALYQLYRLDDYDASRQTFYTSYAEWVNDSTMLCPIIFEAWRDGKVNSIKSPKICLKYRLTSSKALLYWQKNEDEWVQVKSEVEKVVSVMKGDCIVPQRVRVVTASGYVREYTFAPVMMPCLTAFSVNGVAAEITHDLSAYNIYDVSLTLPAGTDLSALRPEWTLMNGDPNLLDGADTSVTVNGEEEESGKSVVDFSRGTVTYALRYTMPGTTDKALSTTAEMRVTIRIE